MKSPLPVLGLVVTHGAAFAAGWLVWTNIRTESSAGEHSVADRKMTAAERQRRSLREEAGPGGERVLRQLFGANPFTLSVENEDWGKSRRDHYAKLLVRAAELPPAENRVTAAADAIAAFAGTVGADDKTGDPSEMTSRLIHWMQVDPDGAIAYLGSITDSRVRKHVTYYLGQAAMAVTTRTGLVEAAKWFRGNGDGGQFNNQLRSQMARELGANADPGEIAAVNQQLESADGSRIDAKLLATSWPIEKADDFLAVAGLDASPDTFGYFATKHGEAGAKWFEDLLASGKLPPEQHEAIVTSKAYGDFMLQSPSVDLDKRLQVLASLNPDRPAELLLAQIGNRDIGGLLKNGTDYRFAFRNGSMTAEEVVAAVSSALPQLAAKSPDTIRTYLFGELAEEDGPKAMSLLGNLPEEEKWKAAMKPVVSMFHGVNPQQFYDYLQHVPADASPQSLDERVKAWTNLGRENHTRLGTSYLSWVRGLPEGLDKDMAALSIVQSADRKDQKLADEFAASIKDERIRQRIPWKP